MIEPNCTNLACGSREKIYNDGYRYDINCYACGKRIINGGIISKSETPIWCVCMDRCQCGYYENGEENKNTDLDHCRCPCTCGFYTPENSPRNDENVSKYYVYDNSREIKKIYEILTEKNLETRHLEIIGNSRLKHTFNNYIPFLAIGLYNPNGKYKSYTIEVTEWDDARQTYFSNWYGPFTYDKFKSKLESDQIMFQENIINNILSTFIEPEMNNLEPFSENPKNRKTYADIANEIMEILMPHRS